MAVEAALVTPLLILILFGIIEFGMLFKDWIAVTSSVRAGARIASAEPRIDGFAQDAADQVAREGTAVSRQDIKGLWVYKAASDGTPVGGAGTFSDCTQCAKFTWNASTSSFQMDSDSWSSTMQNACPGDDNHDSVGVYLLVDHPSVTGLIFKDFNISEHTVMQLEPIPLTQGCKAS